MEQSVIFATVRWSKMKKKKNIKIHSPSHYIGE